MKRKRKKEHNIFMPDIVIWIFIFILLGCNSNVEIKDKRPSTHVYFAPHFLVEVTTSAKETDDGVPYGRWSAYIGNDSMIQNLRIWEIDSLSFLLPDDFASEFDDDKLYGSYGFINPEKTALRIFIDSLDRTIAAAEFKNYLTEQLGGIASICIDNESCDVIEHTGNFLEFENDIYCATLSFLEQEDSVKYCRLGYLGFIDDKSAVFLQYEFVATESNINLNMVLFSEIISSLKNNGNFLIPPLMKLENVLPLEFQNQ